jgi:hypothetical protein
LDLYLQKLSQQTSSFVSDYEIDFKIYLWSENKYLLVKEMEGNPFFESEPFWYRKLFDNTPEEVRLHKHFLFETNHNFEPEKFGNQPLCYLLHELYDHTYLSLQDIADIEEVWIEVVLRVQNFSKVEHFSTK